MTQRPHAVVEVRVATPPTPLPLLPQAGPVVLGAFFESEMYISLGYWVALLQVVGLGATLVAYKASTANRRLAATRDT